MVLEVVHGCVLRSANNCLSAVVFQLLISTVDVKFANALHPVYFVVKEVFHSVYLRAVTQYNLLTVYIILVAMHRHYGALLEVTIRSNYQKLNVEKHIS